jgi:hypothetical protein
MVLKGAANQLYCTLSSKRLKGIHFIVFYTLMTYSWERKFLVIDCRELLKTTSDAQLFSTLARQVGYWPVFGFLNSMGHLVDLAAVGLTGQKGKRSYAFPLSTWLTLVDSWLQHFLHRTDQIHSRCLWLCSHESFFCTPKSD